MKRISQSMIVMRKGTKVKFINEKLHKEEPAYCPEVGTKGEVMSHVLQGARYVKVRFDNFDTVDGLYPYVPVNSVVVVNEAHHI